MTKDKDNKDWKFFEEIVTILEGKINKESNVVQNVNLPVIDSPSNRVRQCDVVIYTGNAPRQTMTIVEVQKRGSKPDINTFNGWLEKMKEVGAQHLLCVSQQGFPASIQEKAEKIGPSVRLLTLGTLKDSKLPIQSTIFHNKLQHVTYENFHSMEVEFVHLVRQDNQIDTSVVKPFEHYFKLPSDQTVSVSDLADWHFFGLNDSLKELPKGKKITIGIKYDMPDISYNYRENDWVKIKSMLIYVEIVINEIDLNWEFKEYKQLDYGDLAWSILGEAVVGTKQFKIVVPLTKENSSEYHLGRPIIISDHDAFVSIGKSSIKANNYNEIQSNVKKSVLIAMGVKRDN